MLSSKKTIYIQEMKKKGNNKQQHGQQKISKRKSEQRTTHPSNLATKTESESESEGGKLSAIGDNLAVNGGEIEREEGGVK